LGQGLFLSALLIMTKESKEERKQRIKEGKEETKNILSQMKELRKNLELAREGQRLRGKKPWGPPVKSNKVNNDKKKEEK